LLRPFLGVRVRSVVRGLRSSRLASTISRCDNYRVTKQGHVEIEGAKLFYEEDGTGEPLILIHANILDHRMWDLQVEPFARRYRVIRVDERGYGRSEWHPGPYSDHSDLFGLLRSFGLDEVHLVGLSMGANAALEFALMYPVATKSLVVVPGGIAGHQLPEWFDRGFDGFVSAARDGDFGRAIDLVMDFPPMRPAGRIPSVRSALRSIMEEYSWVSLFEDYGKYVELQPPVYERLEEISCPTLIISGDLDIEEFREEAEVLARRVPGADLVRIGGAGHMVNMERPAEFNTAVLTFLARTSSQA